MTIIHTKRKKPLTLNVATYNARSLSSKKEKVIEMETEMSKIKWYVGGVSEVK